MPNDAGKYSNTVRGIVESIAFQLNDAEVHWEHSTWDEQWIIARVFDAFKWFQKDDPGLFSEEKEIELKVGSHQTRPKDCDNLISVNYVVDEKGRHHPVFEADYAALKSATVYDKLMPACAYQSCTYHFAMNGKNKDEFLINPPVPPGGKFTYIAICSDIKSYFNDKDKAIECEFSQYIPAVMEWVLYQAKIMDGLNPALLAAADSHRNTFFALAPQLRPIAENTNARQVRS